MADSLLAERYCDPVSQN
jgi:hypothetical protein